MTDYSLIDQKIIEERYNSLSDELKDYLESEHSAEIVAQVCRDHNLVDEDKVVIVQQLVSLVILGFIHTYDIGSEINHLLELENPKLAESIGAALKEKVFAPLKADLDKNYRPILAPSVTPMPSTLPMSMPDQAKVNPLSRPRTMEEIKPPMAGQGSSVRGQELKEAPKPPMPPRPTSPGPTLPQGTPSTMREVNPFGSTVKPLAAMSASPSMDQGSSVRGQELSGTQKPPMPPGEISRPPISAMAPPVLKPTMPSPSQQISGGDLGRQTPIANVLPPLIIHKQSDIHPLTPESDFKVAPAPQKFGDFKAPASPAPKMAELELGAPAETKKPTISRTEVSAPRIVHYSQLKTELGSTTAGPAAPGAKSGAPPPVPISNLNRMEPLRPPTTTAKEPKPGYGFSSKPGSEVSGSASPAPAKPGEANKPATLSPAQISGRNLGGQASSVLHVDYGENSKPPLPVVKITPPAATPPPPKPPTREPKAPPTPPPPPQKDSVPPGHTVDLSKL